MITDRGPFRRVALKSYISTMSKPDPRGIFDDFVAEVLVQQGFSIQEDPRSIYEPEQLYDALQRYATTDPSHERVDEHLAYGFRKAFKFFAKPKDMKFMPILSDDEVIHSALKLEKSSGLPLMTSKAKSLQYSLDRERQISLGMKAPNPCVAYKRTQKGNKTRLVWGYPLEMTIKEARFARPIIDHFKNILNPMAFGMSKGDLGACLSRYFEDEKGTTVCLDYSKFDSTVTATMISEAFKILSTWFSPDDLSFGDWKTIVKYFICTPIVMPDGHLYTGKDHGVPSGSYFTQIIDSIVNVALTYALSHKFGFKFGDRQIFVLGDDSIVQVSGPVNVSEWRRYLMNTFGMIIHDDAKTVIGQVHFLGAVWHHGKPDADFQELINKAVFPEKFRDYQGNPGRGAEQVLRSYAANYLSGWKLLPDAKKRYFNFVDRPLGWAFEDSKFMTGSDRLLVEEVKLRHPKLTKHTTSLAERFLL